MKRTGRKAHALHSSVTRNVDPYAIVGGIPAKCLSYKFSPDVIRDLLEIAWWDWDDARIMAAVPLLSSDHVEEFVRRHAPSRSPQ